MRNFEKIGNFLDDVEKFRELSELSWNVQSTILTRLENINENYDAIPEKFWEFF